MILGHLGSDAVAANSLVVVVRNIGTVLCFGVASAGGILLGNVMGEGNLEKAKEYASKLLKLTVVAGAVGGLVVLGITPFVLKFASLNETAMHYLKYMLLINTCLLYTSERTGEKYEKSIKKDPSEWRQNPAFAGFAMDVF